MDQIFGLPAHPLLVHVPVVLLPLAGFGALVTFLRRSWYEQYRWAVLFVGGVGMLGAVLAAGSGEELERQVRATDGVEAVRAVHEHAEAGDTARGVAIVFFLALAVYVVVPWFVDRRNTAARTGGGGGELTLPTWTRPVMMAVVAITAVASLVTIVDAGHSGAERAWEAYDSSSALPGG